MATFSLESGTLNLTVPKGTELVATLDLSSWVPRSAATNSQATIRSAQPPQSIAATTSKGRASQKV